MQAEQLIVCVNGAVYPLREDRRLNVVQIFGEGAELLDPKFRPPSVVALDPQGWTLLKLLPHAHYVVRVEQHPYEVGSGGYNLAGVAPPKENRMLPRKLIVHNLPFYCTAEMLGKFFERFDLVVEADIMRNQDGTPKGKGYVMLQTPKGTIAALQNQNLVFHGSHLHIEGDQHSLVPYNHPTDGDTATGASTVPAQQDSPALKGSSAYFVMKCTPEALADGMTTSTWSVQRQLEQNLNGAWKDHDNVILIFSVLQSKEFSGYAKMKDVVPPRSAKVKENKFPIQWISVGTVPFTATTTLLNEWSDDKPVHMSRDGQALHYACGAKLCSLIDEAKKKGGR